MVQSSPGQGGVGASGSSSGDGPHVGAKGVGSVKSAERTLKLLEYLASSSDTRSLRDIQRRLEIPRSSAYALLLTLLQRDWVEVDETGHRFRLGMRALLAGGRYLEQDEMVRRTARIMDELSAELGETVHLARLDGGNVVYLATRPSRHSLSVLSQPGRRLPAHLTALGKAVLAQHEPANLETLVAIPLEARTAKSITDLAALRIELATTRSRGYAIDDEECTQGIRCFAVALPQPSPPLYALSCAVPVVRLTPAVEEQIQHWLGKARGTLELSSPS